MRRFLAMLFLLMPCALRLAPAASAEPFNYGSAPLGVQADGRGGVSAAWGDDATAVFFNPAGLGLMPQGRWNGVVSGFAEYGETVQKDVLADRDVTGRSLDGMLTFAGAARGTSWGGVGLAFAVPERTSVKTLKRYEGLKFVAGEYEVQFPSGSVSLNTDATTFLVGPALAWRAWEGILSVGVRGFYSLRNAHTARTVFVNADPDTSFGLETVTQQIGHAVRVGAGARARLFRPLFWGLAVDYAIPLKNSFTVSRALITVDKNRLRELADDVVAGRKSFDQAINELDRIVTVPEVYSTREEYRQPVIVRTGPRVDLPTGTRLGADVVLFSAVRQYTRMRLKPRLEAGTQGPPGPCDEEGEKQNPSWEPEVPSPFHCSRQKTVVNIHLGAEQVLRPGVALAAGFYTDFSNHPSLSGLFKGEGGEEKPELTDEKGFQIQAPSEVDLYHLTVGLSYVVRNGGVVSPSVSYSWGRGSTLSVAPVQKRTETRNAIRAALGVSFEF